MKYTTIILILILAVMYSHSVSAQANKANNAIANMQTTGFELKSIPVVKDHVGNKKTTASRSIKQATKDTAIRLQYKRRKINPAYYC